MRSIRAVLLAALALAPAAALALLPEDGQPTLSPYFHVPQADGGEPLPLEETRAEVTVAGPIARVTVHQTFRNRGSRPIEAVYVFPASTRAAVHALAMRIGERTIEARIDRRDRARAGYEAARDGGQRAALLEQERPNVFTMNVANVLPGERIEVALEYSELLVPEDGDRTSSCTRRSSARATAAAPIAREDRWIASPYLRAGRAGAVAVRLRARASRRALPLRDLSSPSHALDVRFAVADRGRRVAARAGRRQPRRRAALPPRRRRHPGRRAPASPRAGRRLASRSRWSRRARPARPRRARRASTSSSSTCPARCTASRSTPRRR